MKRRFVAEIKRGRADEQPKALPTRLALLLKRARAGDDVCGDLGEFVVANFVKENVANVDDLFNVDDEVAAVDVSVYAVTFDDDALLPRITAGATFDLEVKRELNDDKLMEWQEEHDFLTDAVNFFWHLDDDTEIVVADNDGAGFGLDGADDGDET